MFSSSIFTTDTSSLSQGKTGSVKVRTDQPAEDGDALSESADTFAKEFQAVVIDEQEVKSEKAVTSESQTEPTNVADNDNADTNKLLIENAEGDIEISTNQQNAQISISQKEEDQPDLDSTKKQQIMSDAEELLSRLSESNKQLSLGEDNVSEGKKLPSALAADEASSSGNESPNLTQEELAKVFAAQEDPQMNADAELTDNQESTELDAATMALASGDTASAASREVKGKAGSVFAPTASGGAFNSNSQSLITDTNQELAASVGNPALSSSASTLIPGMMAANAGTVEDQLTNTAGIAADCAALMTALEHGATDNSTEAKSAEQTHSLSGLTTQQGLTATAQARTEAALAQSPLQLSKEQAGDQIGERMQMMMSKNLKHVDIRLDPPELGKLQIKLSLNQDQASVQFTVGNQQTRDLVEHAMPRLRELLNQQGLQLAQSSVQQDSSRQQFAGQPNQQHQGQQAESGGQHNGGTSHGQDAGLGTAEPVDMYVSQSTDRVDYYA